MEQNLKMIDDAASFEHFRTLLRSSNLPADDLDYKRDMLVGYIEDNAMVGTGGLEVYGDYALLRSLSVKFGIRGKALGTTITEHLIAQARERKLKAIYLLTENAHGFFSRKGFSPVKREDVPQELNASSEFSHVCPTSAVVMQLVL
ncbi:arsenic resistance N-acetyltransferase ArsN2 [Chryseolinea lacunae]|uniref:GNAT family N-acetyltransferase n=1 Tax=Chryseolinea lacunae TaxID=2801331 RepID=A0ABS1KYF3_9BACT|nr:arsenic resistance N-acetyltransferase ArsN2 [Chryseolinea lacunae]MBL0744409.1 GNAT family N-acetyltransferase [Chryseolinea lacunae]